MHSPTKAAPKPPLNTACLQKVRKVMYYSWIAKLIYVLGLQLGYVALRRETYMTFETKRSPKHVHVMISVLKCISRLRPFAM